MTLFQKSCFFLKPESKQSGTGFTEIWNSAIDPKACGFFGFLGTSIAVSINMEDRLELIKKEQYEQVQLWYLSWDNNFFWRSLGIYLEPSLIYIRHGASIQIKSVCWCSAQTPPPPPCVWAYPTPKWILHYVKPKPVKIIQQTGKHATPHCYNFSL